MDTDPSIKSAEADLHAARRGRPLWLAVVFAVAAAFLIGAAAMDDGIGPRQGLVQQVTEGVVQRGMIIPYCREDLPPGYRWCNGNDPKDYPQQDNVFPDEGWVPQHLRGRPLPDLNGRFVRGVAGAEMVGASGGKDGLADLKTAEDGQHSHSVNLPTKTGRITEREQGTKAGCTTGQTYGHGYDIVMPSGEYKYGMHLPVASPASGQGNHANYYLDGGTVRTVDTESKHEYSLPDIPTVPSYIGVKYIIRVR